ncbi:MAG: DUF1844 domain-containing protein [Planctomycetota bacterium]|nr:DUF1844 domain-containing protein [Planctomycetota bacterium]MDI6787741.1 DUF1844 domain-containing protein [Planctomycetota bacterium]
MTDEKIQFEKKVDEEWKQQAIEEKEQLSKQEEKEPQELPPPDFNTYLASLSAQSLIALGQMENPLTKKKEVNLIQAHYLIDLLSMLKEKTKGNLTRDEEDNFQNLLYNLQLLYVKVSQKNSR